MSVTHRGTGTAVVIIPGVLGGAFSFRKVSAELSSERNVLVVDPLGTGGSSRPKNSRYSMQAQAVRIAAVLDSMGIERAVVVGHAAGVPIALRLALLRPAMVSGVIAVNGSASEKFESGGLKMALRFAPILKFFGGAKKAEQKVVAGMREHSADESWVTADVVTAYTAPYRNDLSGTLRVLDAITSTKEPWPLLPRLSDLRVPVVLTVSAGGRKPVVKPEDVVAFKAALPALRIDSLETVGAFVQEERPDLMIQAIKRINN